MKTDEHFVKVKIETEDNLPKEDKSYFVVFTDGHCASNFAYSNQYKKLWLHDVGWYLLPEQSQQIGNTISVAVILQAYRNAKTMGYKEYSQWLRGRLQMIPQSQQIELPSDEEIIKQLSGEPIPDVQTITSTDYPIKQQTELPSNEEEQKLFDSLFYGQYSDDQAEDYLKRRHILHEWICDQIKQQMK